MPQDDDRDEKPTLMVRIQRPVLTQPALNELTGHTEQDGTIQKFAHKVRTTFQRVVPWRRPTSMQVAERQSKSSRCQKRCDSFGLWLLGFFPFIGILSNYDLKTWLLNDVISGFTVGIMHVPQGMAYALLATLPPVFGLYTSFFPPLIYFFLGTSRHISIGTIAVVSLLTGEFLDQRVQKELGFPETGANTSDTGNNFNSTDGTMLSGQAIAIRMSYAPALALAVGITQILMGISRLGSVTRYLSGPMTSGFTVGVAVHVFTSQVPTLFGVKIGKQAGIFAVPKNYYEIFRAIGTTNGATTGLSAICIIILIIFKLWINPPIIKRIRVPIPVELLLVVFGTLTSYYLDLNGKYDVKVVGYVSQGIPDPHIPAIWKMHDAIVDIIVLAIIAFSVNISLSRIFAKNFGYTVDGNQELFAYGFANAIGSFFHTYPSAASLSRSAVQVSSGGKTQVATVFSSILLILVLYFIGPLFYSVPNCCLASIIVVALKGMFMNAFELKYLWKYSLWDFTVWVLTFLCTVIVDVKYGLLIGVAYSALSIILRTQSPKTKVLGQADGTELYQDVQQCINCTEIEGIKVVRYEGNLHYACADHFRRTIYVKAGVDPMSMNAKFKKLRSKLDKVEKQLRAIDDDSGEDDLETIGMEKTGDENGEISTFDAMGTLQVTRSNRNFPSVVTLPRSDSPERERVMLNVEWNGLQAEMKKLENSCKLQHLILDCSVWNFVDYVGAEELKLLASEYERIAVSVSLACLADNILQSLQTNGKLGTSVEVYPSIHDAVLSARIKLEDNINRRHMLNQLPVTCFWASKSEKMQPNTTQDQTLQATTSSDDSQQNQRWRGSERSSSFLGSSELVSRNQSKNV